MQIDSVTQHRASFLQDKLPWSILREDALLPREKVSMSPKIPRAPRETSGGLQQRQRRPSGQKTNLIWALVLRSWSQQPGLHLHQELQTSNESIHFFNMS